ncbi:hypothetical protein PTTG_26163 [Puccinia triticina 1-1 BBBD Race 1]|uniref:Uncharacterized protein n=2 Tax=Puccinia triticina TaxID=208348 RepID=A0A180GXB5_PUCT1|nr:uncharacterized protein PtA15_6A735 [Puccinia triticina]OAV97161.1 hypothetical protein PTTG_26163 [Puccinia triticina 1-1 BBBD Race 1]WAQ86105.1 hypothetical protein PtA15_6A735 [Puccinia triticina]WAR55992.1 hypothetical protein PtB15_6B736 [Puccinia triticina]
MAAAVGCAFAHPRSSLPLRSKIKHTAGANRNSHHKKPIKATIPKAHLYISEGRLSSDNPIPIPTDKDELARSPSRQILHHPFTSQINLLLSHSTASASLEAAGLEPPGPPELLARLSDIGTYQHIANLNLADLLGVDFAKTYLRSGSLVALSVPKLVGDDLFAIDGYGTIHMRLCQSTYQTLGISGRRSKYGSPGQHFVVEIDMRDPAMRSGKAVYERTKRCLDAFPGSVFNDLLGPKHELRGRRWEVVMVWVDEQGRLQPINASLLQPTTTFQTRVPEISRVEKRVPQLSQPDTVEGYLDLYEQIGEAILSTSDNHPVPKGGIAACAIEAVGFFHPIKLAELTGTLIKTYRIVSITGHTARSAPFSFLTLRQTHRPGPAVPSAPKKAKKAKKGKGAMLGPERGVNAGPSSWTFVALGQAKDSSSVEPSPGPADPTRSPPPVPAIPDISIDSPADLVVRKRPRIENDPSPPPLGILTRPWIIFESVGALDTHC